MSETAAGKSFRPAIPAAATLGAVLILLLMARFYDHLPVKSPGCSFRTVTGLPCLACGGTRSMMSLSRGEVVASFQFNPLVFLGVVAVPAWFGISIWKVLRGIEPGPPMSSRERARANRWILAFLVAAALANWVYLVNFLPK